MLHQVKFCPTSPTKSYRKDHTIVLSAVRKWSNLRQFPVSAHYWLSPTPLSLSQGKIIAFICGSVNLVAAKIPHTNCVCTLSKVLFTYRNRRMQLYFRNLHCYKVWLLYQLSSHCLSFNTSLVYPPLERWNINYRCIKILLF